jgi:hypothetical protein
LILLLVYCDTDRGRNYIATEEGVPLLVADKFPNKMSDHRKELIGMEDAT